MQAVGQGRLPAGWPDGKQCTTGLSPFGAVK